MFKRVYSILLFFLGGIAGGLFYCFFEMNINNESIKDVSIEDSGDFSLFVLFVIIFGLIFRIFAPALMRRQKRAVKNMEKELASISLEYILVGTLGLIIGFIIALLISMSYRTLLPGIWYSVVTMVLYVVLGYLGFNIVTIKTSGSSRFLDGFSFKNSGNTSQGRAKVIDTSVIIDGRILDIMRAGFIDGRLIIPTCVLDELRHIADSSDSLKRVRGRRGLDVLNRIREEFTVEIFNIQKFKVIDEIPEVDVKLIKLAKELKADLITTDFNLNKVATINDIKVLNINELANAIKPIVIPGEKMIVDIVKRGKDKEQGIGYLDDGTMIVVEDGADHIAESVAVTVTSVLQTSAGKMIFGRINLSKGDLEEKIYE